MRFTLTQAAQSGSDIYQTPPVALQPLLPYLNPDWIVWEPSCGEGRIIDTLRQNGNRVVGTDLKADQDFLTMPDIFNGLPEFDCIVTNPPYSVKDDYLTKCYDLRKPFALLMPLTALGGAKRQNLYRRHGLELILMGKRINFKPPTKDEKDSSAWFETAWFTWGLNVGQQITFATIGEAERVYSV